MPPGPVTIILKAAYNGAVNFQDIFYYLYGVFCLVEMTWSWDLEKANCFISRYKRTVSIQCDECHYWLGLTVTAYQMFTIAVCIPIFVYAAKKRFGYQVVPDWKPTKWSAFICSIFFTAVKEERVLFGGWNIVVAVCMTVISLYTEATGNEGFVIEYSQPKQGGLRSVKVEDPKPSDCVIELNIQPKDVKPKTVKKVRTKKE